MNDLKTQDPAIWQAIQAEAKRQKEGLEMIASENYTSFPVMQAVGSVLTNKYAEGYITEAASMSMSSKPSQSKELSNSSVLSMPTSNPTRAPKPIPPFIFLSCNRAMSCSDWILPKVAT
jgi:hypothetical protein